MNKPFITLKVIKTVNGRNEEVKRAASRKRTKVLFFLQAKKPKNCMFFVGVSYEKGYKNEGEYETKKDLIFALKAFTEKDLIKDFCE